MLAEIAAGLTALNSAKSLFGGGGSSEGDSMKRQYAWNAYSARTMPSAQVEGLRAAGLNPMLAIGQGGSQPNIPQITSSPGKDAEIATARQLAAAQTLNQAAQAKLYEAQADKVKGETPSNDVYQEGVSSASALNRQKAQSEVGLQEKQRQEISLMGYQAGTTLSQTHLNAALEKQSHKQSAVLVIKGALDGLQLKVNELYLSPTAKAELDQKLADLRTKLGQAAEGDYNVKFWESEIGQIMETARRATSIAKPQHKGR